jgi:hypothetical protein
MDPLNLKLFFQNDPISISSHFEKTFFIHLFFGNTNLICYEKIYFDFADCSLIYNPNICYSSCSFAVNSESFKHLILLFLILSIPRVLSIIFMIHFDNLKTSCCYCLSLKIIFLLMNLMLKINHNFKKISNQMILFLEYLNTKN